MADRACLYFQWHFALRGVQRGKKCTANKAFKGVFFFLLHSTEGGLVESHSLSILHRLFENKERKKNLLYWCKCISLSFSVFSETADWENLWPFFPISFGIYCVFHLGTGHLRRVCWDFCFDPEEDDWSITLKAEWLGRGRQTRGQFCSRGVLGSSLWSTVFLQKPLNLLFTWQILLALCSRCLSLRQGGSSKSLDAGNCERVQRQTEQWRGKEKWSVFCLVAAVDTLRARCWQRQGHQHRCRV